MEPIEVLERKQRVAVVGTGPSGLVAAWALQQSGNFEVTVFESASTYGLSGQNFGHGELNIDIPMRVFSGTYYQNLIKLLDFLGVKCQTRRFLFAYSFDNDRPYLIHPSNLHRRPLIWMPFRSKFEQLVAILNLILIALDYVWFILVCFIVPPRKSSPNDAELCENLYDYAKRVHISNGFLYNYILPTFSGVASCTHEQLLRFPAFYITDYKRLTSGSHHNTIFRMCELENILKAGLKIRLNTKVTGTRSVISLDQRSTRVLVSIQDQHGAEEFDHAILAISPRAVSKVHKESLSLIQSLETCNVTVTVHKDWAMVRNLFPDTTVGSLMKEYWWTRNRRHDSEILALQTYNRGNLTTRNTVATHIHPNGHLITVASGRTDQFLNNKSHESNFVRILQTPETRRRLAKAFCGKECNFWKNGDGNIQLVGGWTLDSLALLEPCIVSGLRAAENLGAVLPFDLIHRTSF